MQLWKSDLIAPRGVLIGADKNQEWMLDWWYSRYSQKNKLPVAICDFGLSREGLIKAHQIGLVLDFNKDILLKKFKQPIYPVHKPKWEAAYARQDFEQVHSIWMLKPFAMGCTPFKETLWLDIDCQVQCDLDAIFAYIKNTSGFTCALDTSQFEAALKSNGIMHPDEKAYNSGVIGYKYASIVIDLWAEELYSHHHDYPSDQDALSRVIYKHKLPIQLLPTRYNAHSSLNEDPSMEIIHWAHPFGKLHILDQILLDQFKEKCKC